MPKFIAHALTGATIVAALYPKSALDKWTPLLIGAVLAISPDFDYLIEWLLDIPDIHRGFTHSLIFSFLVGLIICFWLRSEHPGIPLAYSFAYLSHTLLDMVASTRGGVKLMYPFSDKYYNFGLIKILELQIGGSLKEAFAWILIETVIFLPIFIIVLLIKKYTH